MDASDVVLDTWTQQVKQIWSELHLYQQESLALAILGIVLAGNAVMQRVAESLQERLSRPCKMTSYERRLQRLIDNDHIAVKKSWEQFVAQSLPLPPVPRKTSDRSSSWLKMKDALAASRVPGGVGHHPASDHLLQPRWYRSRCTSLLRWLPPWADLRPSSCPLPTRP